MLDRQAPEDFRSLLDLKPTLKITSEPGHQPGSSSFWRPDWGPAVLPHRSNGGITRIYRHSVLNRSMEFSTTF